MQGPVHRTPLRPLLASARTRASVSVVVAIAVHAVVAFSAARLTTPRGAAVPLVEASLIWMESLEPQPEEAVSHADGARDATPAPLRAPPSRSRGGTRPPALAPSAPASIGGVSIGGVSIGGVSIEATEVGGEPAIAASAVIEPEREVPRTIDLDPGRVARALVLGGAEGPIAPPQEGASTEVRALGEQEAEALLTGDLGRRAMAKAYVTPRRPIRLSPHPDGTFTYDGSGFDATIRPDGTVAFRDRDDATIEAPTLGQTQPMTDVTGAPLDSASLFRDVPVAGIQIGGTLDGDSALTRARGEDPHRFERERFLEETQELRERLEDQARARDLARADRRRRDARDAGPE